MANVSYTVKKGDTLSQIAVNYSTTVDNLLSLNPDITNKDLIYVGQVIIISGDAAAKTTNISQKVKTTAFGLKSNTDRTVFATWAFDKRNVKNYEVEWKYATGDGVDFYTDKKEVTVKQAVYNAPENATHITLRVKPIPKSSRYWTGTWSTKQTYYFEDNPPSKPDKPSDITLDRYKLTVKVTNLEELNASHMRFKVEESGKETVFTTSLIKATNGSVSYSITIEANKDYRLSCQAYRDDIYSEWSEWSDTYSSGPPATEGIYLLYALSSTSVGINWYDVPKVTGYEIQYTEIRRYFDSNPDGVSSKTLGSEDEPVTVGHAEITGLTSGLEYFFRVRSIKGDKKSDWSEIKSITIGNPPIAPTTWSSSTTVNSGDTLNLYWVHNAEDGSRQTESELKLSINGVETTTKLYETVICSSSSAYASKEVSISNFTLSTGAVIRVYMLFTNTSANPTLNVNDTGDISIVASGTNTYYWDANSTVTFRYDGTNWIIDEINASQSTYSYSIDTTEYEEGTVIKWCVRTAGVLKYDDGNYIYGPWSIERSINVYSPPNLSLSLTDQNGNSIQQLESFPINIAATTNSSNMQKPIGYHVTISSNETYETVDSIGNSKIIGNGDKIYYKYFNVTSNTLSLVLSAGDLDLENNITYTINCTVAMDSGLSGEISTEFTVAWMDEEYWPNASILYDEKTFTTSIQPHCKDINDNLIEGITMSVYRREFDGSFTELATGLDNTEGTYITDPHPSLDYARYRVVAITNSTGAVSYYDVPGYPINEKSIIIQWDEKWSSFDYVEDADLEKPPWNGSLLKLPYNIDISDDYSVDVELVNYIGRKYPVGYYGTKIGHSSTWSTSIPKYDKETLYGLRRLALWTGDVYVREPSGSGYWANITVSFSQEHCELSIPVTLKIKRVEGGI